MGHRSGAGHAAARQTPHPGRADQGLSRSRRGRAAGEPGLHSWAVALAEEGRHAEAAAVYADLVEAEAHDEASSGTGDWNLMAWAVQREAAGDIQAAIARSNDLVERCRLSVDQQTGPMACLVYALVNHARLLGISATATGAHAALQAAEPICVELARTGEPKSWSGYQTTYWAVLLAASGRADEQFPPTGPRPPLGVSFQHWSPHVRGWWGDQERATLQQQIQGLRPHADAAPERHLKELVRLHRRLLIRTAVHVEFRTHLLLEPLKPIFDQGVTLARRLRPLDNGTALRTALLDRSTLLLAGKDYKAGYNDLREALTLTP